MISIALEGPPRINSLFTLVLVLAAQLILLHKLGERLLDGLCVSVQIQAQVEERVERIAIVSAVVTSNSRAKTTSPDFVYPRGFPYGMRFFSAGGGDQHDANTKTS